MMRILGKVLKELRLIELNKTDGFRSAFDKLIGGATSEIEVDFHDPGQDTCQGFKVLLIKIWELFLRQDRLDDVKDRVDYRQASLNYAEVSSLCLGCFHTICSLQEKMRREVLNHVIHLCVQII